MRLRLGVLALLFFAEAIAVGDKVDLLTSALLTDPSFRVKAQAALTLGKLKLREPRVVQALIEALMHDDNPAVRAVAAEALGKIGNPSAADALQMVARDASPFVRTQAHKALALLGHGSTAPEGGGKVFLALSLAPGKAPPEHAKMVRERVERELSRLPNVTLQDAPGAPLQRFVVDGNITNLSSTPPDSGGRVRTDCDVRFVVATYPEKSIKMMATVGGSLDGTADPKDIASAQKDCLSDAAKQISEKVQTFLQTR